MRDLTWLSDGRGSSRAAAHARFVIAHQLGREFREQAPLGQLPGGEQAEGTLRLTVARMFSAQMRETPA